MSIIFIINILIFLVVTEILDFTDWYMWRCFEPYGCFYIGPPWSGENRPVSTFPARPDSINPRYQLYTRDKIGHPHELKIDKFETIREAPLRNQSNLYLIIHGFLDNGDKTWVMVSLRFRVFRISADIGKLRSEFGTWCNYWNAGCEGRGTSKRIRL